MRPVAVSPAALVFGVACALFCSIAEATLFKFSWHGDPARDTSIVSSTNPSLRATGTIAIDAASGSTFTLNDITATEIAVTGDSIADFIFSTWVEAGGAISADGSEAFFSGPGNPFSATSLDTFFGCRSPGCEFNFAIDVTRVPPNVAVAQVVYGSAADALAAFKMHAIAVAEPGSGPILMLACLVLLATVRRGQSQRDGQPDE